MKRSTSIAELAEPVQIDLKRRVWRDRTLIKTHAVCVAFGVASVLWVQANTPPAHSATPTGTTTPSTALAASQSPVGKG